MALDGSGTASPTTQGPNCSHSHNYRRRLGNKTSLLMRQDRRSFNQGRWQYDGDTVCSYKSVSLFNRSGTEIDGEDTSSSVLAVAAQHRNS